MNELLLKNKVVIQVFEWTRMYSHVIEIGTAITVVTESQKMTWTENGKYIPTDFCDL